MKVKKETLADIHHQCAEIQRHVVLMLENGRVGQEWLLKMKHAHERLDLLIGRINS
jgi:hypothetical protein